MPIAIESNVRLLEKFCGSLLGGMVGDMIGAAVEAESPGYIRKTFQNLDAILELKSVPEFLTGEWEVGHFTDDTQMTLCVAEWLTEDEGFDGKKLLERFSRSYEPWRHYGPGTRLILEAFPQARDRWQELATAAFAGGSFGNGSAMRAAPIGLFLHDDLRGLMKVACISSRVTHSHLLALQGATLQAVTAAIALKGPLEAGHFLRVLSATLSHFREFGQDTTIYEKALVKVAQGLSRNVPPAEMATVLGNGIKAQEAVPMALYCFLANLDSYVRAVESAIFLGGDTDTIATMTGALAGAALGESKIPSHWIERSTESNYTPQRIRKIASSLFRKGQSRGFKSIRGESDALS